MPEIDSFLRAYITTALWSSHDESDESGGEPMDSNYGIEDIAPATLERMAQDCKRFSEQNAKAISAAIETGDVRCGPDFDEYDRAAHDFWLTRNHHGAGFWDGDWPEPYATTLTDAAHAFGDAELYIGDDGLIYQFGAEN